MMIFDDITLTVIKGKVRYKSQLSPEVESDICYDQLTKLTIRRLNRLIGEQPSFCRQEDLRVLGMHLYHILFDGKTSAKGHQTLGDVFNQAYIEFKKKFDESKQQSGNQTTDCRLRITLTFEEGMEDIAVYPWEFLYVPRPNETGFFIAGENTGLILTRRLVTDVINRIPPADKLVILVAWSQPKELGPVTDSEIVDNIEHLANGIEKNISGQNITVIALERATHDMLKNAIETNKPQIVHFIGHGRTTKETSEIALMKSPEELNIANAEFIKSRMPGGPDEAHWVDGVSVRALFTSTFPPQLVFLHACNSSKAPDSLEIFKSIAQQVLRAGVPFVVAMQYEISNDDAKDFSKTFYKKLGEGLSIEEAVYAGRIELGRKSPSWGHPRFGTPVVYLQSKDSIIVLKQATAIIEPDKIRPFAQKQLCPFMDCPHSVSSDQRRCDCEKKLKLMQCPNCFKAILADETSCKYCEFQFVKEQTQQIQTFVQQPVSSIQPSQGAGIPTQTGLSSSIF